VVVGGRGGDAQHVAQADDLAVGVGDLHPDRGLAGDRDRIRTSALFTAYAMFFDSWVTRSTLTAGPSWIS
jgi:hypothetical protein